MGIARDHSLPGAQQYNGVAESAIKRCNKVGMASHRSALRRLGPEGFSCIKSMDPRGDRLWAESAKDVATEAQPIGFSLHPRPWVSPGAVYQQEGAVEGGAFSPGGLHERYAAQQAGG